MNAKFRRHFLNAIKEILPCINKNSPSKPEFANQSVVLTRRQYARELNSAVEMKNIEECDTPL